MNLVSKSSRKSTHCVQQGGQKKKENQLTFLESDLALVPAELQTTTPLARTGRANVTQIITIQKHPSELALTRSPMTTSTPLDLSRNSLKCYQSAFLNLKSSRDA